jgi:periplasmic protein TonB
VTIVTTKMHLMIPNAELHGTQRGFANKQNVRLLIALSLLLVLLVAVLVKDRDFWFGSDETAESSAPVSQPAAKPATPAKAVAPAPAKPAARNRAMAGNPTKPSTVSNNLSASSQSPTVAATRFVLPPLDVEVVAGDKHSTVHPGSNVTKVEIPSTDQVSITTAGQPVNAAQHQRLNGVAPAELRQIISTVYPALGNNSRVQGSVVLQAIVGADGVVENLQVVSGPSILAAAAQQAVREWHFKPVLQNGQPVETKARIMVNFTIRVSDNPASAS